MLTLPTSRAAVPRDRRPSYHAMHVLEVLKILGRGGVARVKLVRVVMPDGSTQLQAMKVIDKWDLLDDCLTDDLSRATIERDFLVQNCHSSIASLVYLVSFKSCHQTPHHLYFFFEYCRKGDLLSYLQSHGALPNDRVLEAARQLVTAVNYVHACGFIHSDVSLENILISEEGDLRLTDFGSCVREGEYSSDWNGVSRVVLELAIGKRVNRSGSGGVMVDRSMGKVLEGFPVSSGPSFPTPEVELICRSLWGWTEQIFSIEKIHSVCEHVATAPPCVVEDMEEGGEDGEEQSDTSEYDPLPLRSFSFEQEREPGLL